MVNELTRYAQVKVIFHLSWMKVFGDFEGYAIKLPLQPLLLSAVLE
jgi:hypothetical protein